MGILNVTDDSFSGDGLAEAGVQAAVDRAMRMVEEGARIIDVGGESTRPEAVSAAAAAAREAAPFAPADAAAEAACAATDAVRAAAPAIQDELARVLPVVQALAARGVCASIDTRHPEVARACVEAGAAIINDVSGFADPRMVELAQSCDAGLVVVHCGGHFQGERELACDDIVAAVCDGLRERAAALQAAGIDRARICVDPGPGFGKSNRQTIELVYNFHELRHLGYPVMAALSRKSFIGDMYRISDPAQRDDASAEQALMACELGAGVVRAHNVAATAAALKDLRPYCIVGLGCNVPLVANPGEEQEAKIAQLNMAIGDMCLLPDTQIVDVSGFYESEPAYYENQDSFVNAVVLMRTGIAPKELLGYLHAIENSMGRVREIEKGPRTLDLDIEDYQTYVCESDVLTLPHVGLCDRDFVVKPLEDILPGHILADGTPAASVPEAQRIGRAYAL